MRPGRRDAGASRPRSRRAPRPCSRAAARRRRSTNGSMPSRSISRTRASLASATSRRVRCSSSIVDSARASARAELVRSRVRVVSSAASEAARRRSRIDATTSRSISARPAKAGSDRCERRGGGGGERDAPGPAAELGVSDRGAGGALCEHSRPVGDADVEAALGRPVIEATDELARDDGACDEPVRALRR